MQLFFFNQKVKGAAVQFIYIRLELLKSYNCKYKSKNF